MPRTAARRCDRPAASITVPNALHGDRLWTRIGPAGDGRLSIWASACVVCGQSFEVKALSPRADFHTVTRPAHRFDAADKARLRGSHSKGHADRLAASKRSGRGNWRNRETRRERRGVGRLCGVECYPCRETARRASLALKIAQPVRGAWNNRPLGGKLQSVQPLSVRLIPLPRPCPCLHRFVCTRRDSRTMASLVSLYRARKCASALHSLDLRLCLSRSRHRFLLPFARVCVCVRTSFARAPYVERVEFG